MPQVAAISLRTCMSATAITLIMGLLSCKPSVADPELHRGVAERLPGEVAAGPFRLALPSGWRVVESRPSPTVPPGTVSRGAVALRAEGPAGRFAEVWFACPGTELGGDFVWRLEPDSSGRGVRAIVETLLCPFANTRACIDDLGRPGSMESEEMCRMVCGGDGRLDITAFFAGSTPFSGHEVCVQLGDATKEGGTREDLRAIARSLRVEGPVGAAEPAVR